MVMKWSFDIFSAPPKMSFFSMFSSQGILSSLNRPEGGRREGRGREGGRRERGREEGRREEGREEGREGVLKLNPLASEATMLTCSYRASS